MMQRLGAIDVLRFVAALLVLMHHWWWVSPPALKAMSLYPDLLARHGGTLGVLLFFTISGFVILMSAQQRTAGEFVQARIVRLYPAFWVCCTLTWLARIAQPTGPTFGEYLVNLTMFPRAGGVQMVDGVYWTLAVEAKFYLLVAVVLALGRLQQIDRVLWAWLVLARLLPAGPEGGLLASAHAPFFVGGCACCLLRRRWHPSHVGLLLAAMGCVAWDGWNDHAHEPLADRLLEGSVCGFFPLLLAIARGWLRVAPGPWVVTLGAMSYPIYLLHKEIGYRVFEVWPDNPPALTYAVALTWILLLAWWISRKLEPRLQWRLHTLLAGGGASAGGRPALGQNAPPS